MKQHTGKICIRFMTLAIFVFGGLMIPATAQNQEKKSIDGVSGEEAKVKFLNESLKVIGTKTGFETKVVRNAPYSATVETENIQTFADGNSIKNKNTSQVYRDSEGRTRRGSEIQAKGGKIVKEIFISDPVTGINYTLDENTKKAFRVKVNLQDFVLSKKKPEKLINPDNNVKPIKPQEVLPKNKSADQFDKLSNKDTSGTESLGQKLIEGINCEGKRKTLTVPAGEIGNTLPMNIVAEQWYSPELQVLILTIHRDPRRGETTYRLTNIKRFEPDKSLFEVPANYSIIDKSEIKKKNVNN